MPSSTVEDYLKAILLLQEGDDDLLVSMGQIAAALSVAPGTVTSMVKTLAASGLVSYEPYSGVRLKAAGQQLATRILRRHRLIELFLVEVMAIDWSHVHSEAEQLEHVVSDMLVDRMDEMLGFPAADPHGDPIPTAEGKVAQTDYPSLVHCQLDAPLKVCRITDQNPDFLRLVDRHGLVPGCLLQVTRRDATADMVILQLSTGGTVQRWALGLPKRSWSTTPSSGDEVGRCSQRRIESPRQGGGTKNRSPRDLASSADAGCRCTRTNLVVSEP